MTHQRRWAGGTLGLALISACDGSIARAPDVVSDAGSPFGNSGVGSTAGSGSGSNGSGGSVGAGGGIGSGSGSGGSVAADGSFSWGSSSSGGGGAIYGGGSSGVRCGPGSASSASANAEILALAAGRSHACALLSGGSVVCWGANSYGQLGNGTTCDSPTPIAVPALGSAIAIAAGDDHTCAVLSDRTVRCWGDNLDGQLGNGTMSGYSPQPQAPGTVVNLSGVATIAAGNQHTCAALADGTVQCWGRDATPHVGGSSSSGGQAPSSRPVSVPSLQRAAALAAGYDFMCALLVDGTAQCWGSDTLEQLGDGMRAAFSAVPVAVSSLSAATAIAAGDDHACALRSDGTVRCWGNGFYGQLGNGLGIPGGSSNASSSSSGGGPGASPPVSVANLDGATGFAAGGNHSCAVQSGGLVHCWGWNSNGQLGDGTTTASALPVAVHGLQGVTRIAAGHEFVCAAQSGGVVRCWGANVRGQLGDGTFADSSIPVTVHW